MKDQPDHSHPRPGIRRAVQFMKRLFNYLSGKRFNYTVRKSINGISVRIPYIYGMKCEITEPWMNNILQELLAQREGAFIDVGVNLGQTLVKVKTLDTERQYIGFEPNPACLFYVSDLIRQNRFTECTILPVGLYNQNQVLRLNFYSDHCSDSTASIVEDFRSGHRARESIYVPVVSFENIASLIDIDDISVIKIDVEGAELEVIESLAELMKAYRPTVLIEILPTYAETNAFRLKRQESIESIFQHLGYTLYRVEKEGDSLSSVTEIDSIGIHSDLTKCDYIAAPQGTELGL